MAPFRQSSVLVTGGSGKLGSELRKLLPKALFPTSKEFNVTSYAQMERYLRAHPATIIIHAAAFTSPPLIDKDPLRALEANIIGSANVARLCLARGIKPVYISTDYVFKGDKGNYRESDPVFPVNAYAWSKLGGECAVRMVASHLIVRTSFGEKVFPYDKAFIDHYTSRESVDVIAKKIVTLVHAGARGTVHIGHARRSAHAYAKALGGTKPIGKLSIRDVPFAVPKDTSLSTALYKKLTHGK